MNLREIHWSLYFLFWVAVIVGTGALLGAVLFPLTGWFFHTGFTPWQLVQHGGMTLHPADRGQHILGHRGVNPRHRAPQFAFGPFLEGLHAHTG